MTSSPDPTAGTVRAARLAEGFCPDEDHGALDPRDGWCEQCVARWRIRSDGMVAMMPVKEEMRAAVPLTFFRRLLTQRELDMNYLSPAWMAECAASYRGEVGIDDLP